MHKLICTEVFTLDYEILFPSYGTDKDFPQLLIKKMKKFFSFLSFPPPQFCAEGGKIVVGGRNEEHQLLRLPGYLNNISLS